MFTTAGRTDRRTTRVSVYSRGLQLCSCGFLFVLVFSNDQHLVSRLVIPQTMSIENVLTFIS